MRRAGLLWAICTVVVFVLGTLAPAGRAAAQQVIAAWNFNNPGLNPAAPTPSAGAGSARLTGGALSTGFASGAGSSDPVQPGSGWQTVNYPPQGAASGTAGVVFAVPTTNFTGIALRFDLRHAGGASRFVRVQFATDFDAATGDATWIDAPESAGGGPLAGGEPATFVNARGVSFAGIDGVDDNPRFAVRIVSVFSPDEFQIGGAGVIFPAQSAYQATSTAAAYSTAASLRFDRVEFSGTPADLTGLDVSVTIAPAVVCNVPGEVFTLGVVVTPASGPPAPLAQVFADLSSLGGGSAVPVGPQGAGNFGGTFQVPAGLSPGDVTVPVTALAPDGRAGTASVSLRLLSCQNNTQAPVVISQVYGGGGEAGALFNADFVEIFNRGPAPVSLDGWSVQYAVATAAAGFVDDADVVPLSGTILPGQYKVVRFTDARLEGAPLPGVDFARAATAGGIATAAGRVALVDTGLPIGADCADDRIIDQVGWGAGVVCAEGDRPASGTSVSTALLRRESGAFDSNVNAFDFDLAPPAPRTRATGGFLAVFMQEPAGVICRDDPLTVRATVPPAPASTGVRVLADLTSLGLSGLVPLTDAGSGVWEVTVTPAPGTPEGLADIAVVVSDDQGNTDSDAARLAVGVCQVSCSPVVVARFASVGGASVSGVEADYVELRNRSGEAVDVEEWSVQYGGQSQGLALSSVVPLGLGGGEFGRRVIPPGGALLIRMSAPGLGAALGEADVVASPAIDMETVGGVIAVVSGTEPVGTQVDGAGVVDLVGYGSSTVFRGVRGAPALTAAFAAARGENGCVDRAQNGLDFAPAPIGVPPLSGASAPVDCPPLAEVCQPPPQACSPADIADGFGQTTADGGGPDGVLDSSDLFAFLEAFELPEGDPRRAVADIADDFGQTVLDGGGPNGVLDSSDLFAYLALFELGCPE